MNIPEKFKLGGYTIKVIDKENLRVERCQGGEFHSAYQEIWLEKTSAKQEKEEIFIHEILEAIIYLYEINMTHDHLSTLGMVLHQIIKDNPDIFKD